MEAAVVAMSVPAFWEDIEVWRRIVAKVPPYRLSKFQPALPPRFQQEMLGRYLLDIAGARRYLLGDQDGQIPGIGDLLREVLARGVPFAAPEPPPRPPAAVPVNEVRFIATQEALVALCADLLAHERIGLDVETTLIDRDLCLIQFSTLTYNAVIDARAIDDLSPVADVLESRSVLKIVHNAHFELAVFRRLSIDVHNVFDTLSTSRQLRGRKLDGGHGLGVVCERELGKRLDKAAQISDWARRPLSQRQLDYAALDVEVLLPLYECFTNEMLFR